MTTQNLLIPNVAANDGFAGSAIDRIDNATVNISGLAFGAYPAWVWMRFELTANIAQNSTFSGGSATLRVSASETNSSTTWETDIAVEKVAAPTNPSSYANLIGKTYTTGTRYTNTAITSGVYKEFDITNELQELVNHTALTSGNYIMVVMKFVTGTNQSRSFASRDNGTSTDPELNLIYFDPPASGLAKLVNGGLLNSFGRGLLN